MDKKIKIAIIGVGGISGCHIDNYKKNPDVELYAFCDIDEAKLKMKGQMHGITRLYTDVDTMLAELPEIDAVSVCTWNSQHAPCTIKALDAGKDVICEKPMSINVEDAMKMKEAAERNGKILMLGFVRRYGRDCRIMKDLEKEGDFGDIYYTKARYIRRRGNPGGWFANKEMSGGGCLIDLGVHVIDYVRYVMGCPKPISVYGATFDKLGNKGAAEGEWQASSSGGGICNVEDLAVAIVRFDNGAVLNIETSFELNGESPTDNSIQIFGTKSGAILQDGIKIYSDIGGHMINTTLCEPSSADFSEMFTSEINHFVDCVKNQKQPISTAEDGVLLMKILMGIYESAKTGHEVILD
ncbi:MAG: Gfo/Idh/MocA family oxidoreductase [Clostridia bacterium]|nr:Gfo/Idh/MocA family oxidoreductase [Clostridia bacterium]